MAGKSLDRPIQPVLVKQELSDAMIVDAENDLGEKNSAAPELEAEEEEVPETEVDQDADDTSDEDEDDGEAEGDDGVSAVSTFGYNIV